MQDAINERDQIWHRFLEGDKDAYYILYDEYAENLHKYGYHFSKDKEFVKDCIHDLFLELHKYRKNLSDTNNVQFYLFRSLRRIIHKAQLKLIKFGGGGKVVEPMDNLVFSHEDFLISEETKTEEFKALNYAMKGLTNRQREGLSLKFVHDHSYAEIAEIMGISIESARSIIYLALKELRKCMDKSGRSIQLLVFLTHI